MSLTAAELSSMRSTADDYLPDTCTIQRATQGQDALGGISLSWANLATGVACRMDEPSANQSLANAEASVNSAVGAVAQWPMHFAYNQDITVKDRVIFGSYTYEVAEVLDSSSWLITRL